MSFIFFSSKLLIISRQISFANFIRVFQRKFIFVFWFYFLNENSHFRNSRHNSYSYFLSFSLAYRLSFLPTKEDYKSEKCINQLTNESEMNRDNFSYIFSRTLSIGMPRISIPYNSICIYYICSYYKLQTINSESTSTVNEYFE